MKNQITIFKLVVVMTLFFTLFTNSNKTFAQNAPQESTYFYLEVSGVWNENKTSFISLPIYYSYPADCENKHNYEFHDKAKAAFHLHLKSNYPDAYRSSETHIQVLQKHQYEYMKNMQDANDALNAWKIEQRKDKYKTAETNFTYSCQ